MECKSGRVEVNGVTFQYLEMGRGALVLCLHGFPDNAHTCSELLPALADAGFRAVAPFMRGYAPTSPSADGRYQSVLLAQDAVGLVNAFGAERAGWLLTGWDSCKVPGNPSRVTARSARPVG